VLGSLIVLGLGALSVSLTLAPSAEFSLSEGPPAALGPLASAELANQPEWVSGAGETETNALSFQRRGKRGSFRLTRLKKRSELWVVLPVAEASEDIYVPPKRFQGRLLPLEGLGVRNSAVRALIPPEEGVDSFVLFHGETPKSQRDSLFAALLLAVIGVSCLGFAVRLGRKLPEPETPSA